MSNLRKVKNKENEDILFLVENTPSKFIDGEEYVLVKRHVNEKNSHFIKRKSLIFHWK